MTANGETAEFLVVHVGEHCFGLPTAEVEAALAPQPVTPLPFVPPCVEGLVCVNERILPQLDLHRLFAAGEARGGSEIVVVETARSPCALRVSRIDGKVGVAADELQPLAQEGDGAPVCGRFEWRQESVLVLDLDALARLVSPGEVPEGERGLLGRLHTEQAAQTGAQALDCIALRLGSEHYALALTDLVEILDLPPATPVPGAPHEVEGIAMVRDDALLVLSLAALLRLPVVPGDRRSVVVVAHEDVRYGLRVDAIDGICALDEARLRRLDDSASELGGVLATGDRLMGLLSPPRLIDSGRHAAFLPFVPRSRQQDNGQRRERRRTVLQVRVGDETFGIALEQVQRIVEYCPPEPLQGEAGSLIAGAVSIDGRVLPVVDLAACLRTATEGNTGAWVIVGAGEGEWAVAVREANDILAIPESALDELVAERGSFVAAVANVEGRLLSLLTLAPLLGVAGAQPA